jgi:hypothetical protein
MSPSSPQARIAKPFFGHAAMHEVHPSQYSGITQGILLGFAIIAP